MTLEQVMSAILSVEWLLGASMAIAFRKSVVGFVQSRVFDNDSGEVDGGREPGGQ